MDQDFTTAFSEVLESKTDETSQTAKTTEQTVEPTAKTEGKDPIGSLEEKQKEARERWKYEKRIKELEKQLEEKSRSINPDSDNPLKDLAKTKKWSQDDLVNKALEALEDEGMSSEDAETEVKAMTQDEIIAKVKEELKKEALEKEENEKNQKAMTEVKDKIKNFAKENAEKFPIVDAFGLMDNVYKIISDDFEAKVKEFDEDYAVKNTMKLEEAVKKVNDSLATEIKTALKSENMRKYLLQAIKEEAGSSSKVQLEEDIQLEDEFATLTNDFMRQVTDPKDQRKMTNEEALADAFKYL